MTERRARVTEEFTRQAEPLGRSPALNAGDVVGTVRAALGADPSMTVLDLACGPGIVLATLAPETGRAVGIDVTQAMLDAARSRCERTHITNVSFVRTEAESLPFAPGSFDAVATRLSLHHFADPALVLREARRVLRSNGRLVVADVVSSADPDASALHNALEKLRDPTHVRMLGVEELRAFVLEAGFTIDSVTELTRQREFEEWAEIVDAPERLQPIRTLMRALARAGEPAGIGLRIERDRLHFDHAWAIVSARAAPECDRACPTSG